MAKATKKTKYVREDDLELIMASSDESEDSEREEMFAQGLDDILDRWVTLFLMMFDLFILPWVKSDWKLVGEGVLCLQWTVQYTLAFHKWC